MVVALLDLYVGLGGYGTGSFGNSLHVVWWT